MGDEQALAAIGRIERALARIEAAAGRPPRPDPTQGLMIAELREAHRALRGTVASAISELDTLLANGGDG